VFQEQLSLVGRDADLGLLELVLGRAAAEWSTRTMQPDAGRAVIQPAAAPCGGGPS
jgi:hypothetical protein